jgi:transposase InsO family protein
VKSYTAAELATLDLPGLGRWAHTIRERANRENWELELRPRADGRGLERAYLDTALPLEARTALAHTTGNALASVTVDDTAHRETIVTRVRLVRAALELITSGVPRADAYEAVASGTSYSSRSVQRFVRATHGKPETTWAEALAPRYRQGEQAQAECHAAAWEYLRSDYLRASQPAFAACYRRLVAVAGAQGWSPIPSEKTLLRRIEREVPRETTILLRQGREALERVYPAQERDRSAIEVMGAWNADGHRADVMVRWPDGEEARPIILGFQDVRSGKIVSHRVDRTENQDQVRLAFAQAVERYGAPDHCYLDNGRAFASKWFTGGSKWRFRFKVREEDTAGLLIQLGVTVHWTTPYHGQSKPIERAWRDLAENVSRHPAFEGAYLGNSTVTKPHNYGSRVVDLADFLRVLDAQVKEHNARVGRRGRGCEGRSFDEIFTEGYERAVVRRVTDAQRRLLLLAADKVKVRSESAALHFYGNRFWSTELVALKGELVTVRFDPDHIQEGLFVYRTDGTYVCRAELHVAAGFNDTTAARDHARKRAQFVKAVKKAAEAEQTLEASELQRLHLEAQGAPEPAPKATRVVRPAFGVTKAPELERRDGDQESFLRELGAEARSRLTPRRASGSD